MDNQGFALKIKNNQGDYIDLLPKTSQSQVIGWNIGEIYGPYTFVLKAENWVDNQQSIPFSGISSADLLTCVKILSGTEEEQKQQDYAYGLLLYDTGIESDNNQIRFTCSETPTVDFQVQIWWTK